MQTRPKSKLVVLVQICLLTGTLDAIAAILIGYNIPPAIIFKFIASGWFGRRALSGGTSMIFWGLSFHYMIAAIISIILFVIYPGVKRFINSKYLLGIIFGLAIWIIMNFFVLPFTNIPKTHAHLEVLSLIKGISALIICIGMPVALMAEKRIRRPTKISSPRLYV